MNPDAIIEALQRELKGCTDSERKKAIREEIKAVDGLERPPIITDSAQLEVADFDRAYLDGLREELERASKDRQKEIKVEIAHVQRALKPKVEEPKPEPEEPEADVTTEPEEDHEVDDTLSPEEIEQRRQARSEQGVEQARSAPIPGQAVPATTTAPAQGAEETSTDE